MQLNAEQLQQLSDALTRVRSEPDFRLPADVLLQLASSLPEGIGLTVDFEAVGTLGHPLVVLRPSKPLTDCFASLSPRESEVAALVAAGLRNGDVALALGISLGTVKDHVHKVLSKTGLDNRAAIAGEWGRIHG